MDFICFLPSTVLLHFLVFGLRPSALGSDGFFWFCNVQRLFASYCHWFKPLGFTLRWIFFCFLISSVFLHFIAFGLRPLGLGSVVFFFLTSRVFLHFIASGLRPSGLGSDGFFWFCNVQRLFFFEI